MKQKKKTRLVKVGRITKDTRAILHNGSPELPVEWLFYQH